MHFLIYLFFALNDMLMSLSFQVDSGLCEEVVFLKVPGLSGNRMVFACTGPVNRDYDDVRRFSDAAANGIKRLAGHFCSYHCALPRLKPHPYRFLSLSLASFLTGP